MIFVRASLEEGGGASTYVRSKKIVVKREFFGWRQSPGGRQPSARVKTIIEGVELG